MSRVFDVWHDVPPWFANKSADSTALIASTRLALLNATSKSSVRALRTRVPLGHIRRPLYCCEYACKSASWLSRAAPTVERPSRLVNVDALSVLINSGRAAPG